jgi:hypothetical protein
MDNAFQFVEVPEDRLEAIGRPDPGTRVYRKEGPHEELGDWFELLARTVGQTVSPGGVGMFCPVSRAAVHKRCKEGKLSMFLYHVTTRRPGFFGKVKTLRESPYCYIPVSEAKAWRRELEQRALKNEEITLEELQGMKPDWDGKFMQWPIKGERAGLRELLDELGMTPKDALKELFDTVMGTNKTVPPRAKSRNQPKPKREGDD